MTAVCAELIRCGVTIYGPARPVVPPKQRIKAGDYTPLDVRAPDTSPVFIDEPMPAADPDPATADEFERLHSGRSSGRHLTDMGNAERLLDRYGRDLRYFTTAKEWLVWDGTRWEPDRWLRHRKLAAKTVRAIYSEIAGADGKAEQNAILRHAQASEQRARIDSMLSLAEPSCAVTEDDLDQDHELLNTPSGTLDLRTGELEVHNRAHLITKSTVVGFDPHAKCPGWERFIDEITCGDRELADYLQRLVGYTLTGDCSEQILMMLVGSGANGKSTFVNVLLYLLGDYAGTCGKDVLAANQRGSRGGANEELADLRGVRLAAAAEMEQGEPLAEAMVKRITGGELITARKLFGHNITFQPTFTLWLSTNHLPVITGTDDGIWRRIRIVPFKARFTADKADPHLLDKLKAEAAGILAWAVRGTAMWREHGLVTPAAVLEATSDYRQDSDHLGLFIAECCETDPSFKVLQRSLYARYVQWCQEDGGSLPLRSLQLKRELERKGFQVDRATTTEGYGQAVLGLRARSRLTSDHP